MAGEERNVPDAVKDFAELLKEYGVKEPKAYTMAKYIGDTGQPDIFDDPEALLEKLTKWPRDLIPLARATILEHWGAQRGFNVPTELLKRAEVPTEKREKDEEAKRLAEGGRIWFVDRDQKGLPDLRPAKKDEPPMTMAEATEAMRRMAKPEEALVVFDQGAQRHVPNWDSEIAKKYPAAAWATARQYDREMAAGEERDPFEIMTEQIGKIQRLQEVVGPKATVATEKTSVVDLVDALVKLDTLRGKGTGLPDWFSDPIKFNETMDKIMERRLPKQDETVSTELKELRDELKTEREARHKAELDRRDDIIKDQGKRLDRLEDEVKTPRTSTGKTAADLLGDIVQKLPDKSDIRAIPGEVARAIREGERVAPRPPGEQERELGEIEGKLKGQAELTRIENWLLFGEK